MMLLDETNIVVYAVPPQQVAEPLEVHSFA